MLCARIQFIYTALLLHITMDSDVPEKDYNHILGVLQEGNVSILELVNVQFLCRNYGMPSSSLKLRLVVLSCSTRMPQMVNIHLHLSHH